MSFHKPVLYSPEIFDQIHSGPDAEQVAEAAESLAHALVTGGQDTDADDDQSVENLVDLVDEVGMDTLAQLWSDAPAHTLGGTLWRLYALQQGTQQHGEQWAAWYRAGYQAQVSRVIAGAVEPPTAQDLSTLTSQILTGVYSGDFAVALNRAAAYARIISLGMAHHAEHLDAGHPAQARAMVQRSRRMLTTAEQLDASASLYRAGAFDDDDRS